MSENWICCQVSEALRVILAQIHLRLLSREGRLRCQIHSAAIMSDQIKVQGQDSFIVLPWQEAPTASEAGKKLFHDYSESVVKIQNGLSTGTGWIGPDGRVVTAYHVIKGGSDLFAVTADRRMNRLSTMEST